MNARLRWSFPALRMVFVALGLFAAMPGYGLAASANRSSGAGGGDYELGEDMLSGSSATSRGRSMWSAERPESPMVAIDDSVFVLSPGDRLRLRWWGVGSGDERLVVNTQYELVVPDRGVVAVRGRSFREVRREIDSLLKAQLKVRILDLQIEEIAPARIGVSGLVPSPGEVSLPAGARLSDALAKAGLVASTTLRTQSGYQPKVSDIGPLPSLRRVQVVRSGGRDTSSFDLARALNGGDPTQDPYVFTGDRIRVVPQGDVVSVAGGVVLTGFVERIPGESFGNFASAVGATDTDGAIQVTRGGVRRPLVPSSVLDSSAILIEFGRRRPSGNDGLVWIVGFVQKPGGYPIRQGMTAKDLLVSAGGSMGSEDSTVLVSIKRGWQWIQAGRRGGLEGTTQYKELSYVQQDYLLQMRGNYSSPETPIQVGDTVVVSQAEQVVWVGGVVRRPGFVPWRKGMRYEDAVDLAGGYADRAWSSRTRLYDLYNDRILSLDEPVPPGGAVLVPERRYISWDQWVTIVGSVISSVVAAGSFYLQVTN